MEYIDYESVFKNAITNWECHHPDNDVDSCQECINAVADLNRHIKNTIVQYNQLMKEYKGILHLVLMSVLAIVIVNSVLKNNFKLFINNNEVSNAESLNNDDRSPTTVTFKDVTVTIPEGEEFADPKLVLAVIHTESGNNPTALSKKNAYGLMQLREVTAKHMGVDRTDPQQNVIGGSKFLKRQINRFNDIRLGLAAYNYGPAALQKAIKKTKAKTWEDLLNADTKKEINLPKETKNYVNSVILNYK